MAEIRYTISDDVLGFEIIDEEGTARAPVIRRKRKGAPGPERTPQKTAKLKTVVRTEIANATANLQTAGEIFKLGAKDLISRLRSRDISDAQMINILMNDWENRGPLFGRMRSMFEATAEDYMGNVAEATTQIAWEERVGIVPMTWIAVLVNTCPDCFPRHGRTRDYDEWQALGLPRSGFSACRQRCQCKLIPSNVAESFTELRDPIRRMRGDLLKVAREKRKLGRIKNVRDYVNSKLGKINNPQDPVTGKIARRKRGGKRIGKKFIQDEFIKKPYKRKRRR